MNCALKSWCTAATVSAITTAIPCLCRLSCPDETVSVDPLERKKKFIRGRVAHITQASPDRVAPRCPHFGTCGGCNYQHMPYELQVRAKTDILRETLSRLGRIAWDGPVVPHASPPFEYRNRAQWKIAQSRRWRNRDRLLRSRFSEALRRCGNARSSRLCSARLSSPCRGCWRRAGSRRTCGKSKPLPMPTTRNCFSI